MTLNGAGAAGTIIEVGTDSSNRIATVIGIGSYHATIKGNLTLNGVTVRYGRAPIGWAEGGITVEGALCRF